MHAKHTEIKSAGEVLREHGFRVTNGRIRLLNALHKSGKPLSIQEIKVKVRDSQDQATLYRTLTDLTTAGIVKRVDLNTGIARFEYTPDRPHHHHIICTGCGIVEDIEFCSIDALEKQITQGSRVFKSIATHNLEFFGSCKDCVAA